MQPAPLSERLRDILNELEKVTATMENIEQQKNMATNQNALNH